MRALALLERGLYAEVMKILFLGDVMGRAGRQAITNRLPGLRADWALDFVVVNGENASAGAGLTPAHAKDLLAAGADCVTLGDHSFDQKDMLQFIETEPRILRPLNYAKGAPGKGARLFTATQGRKILVMQGLGQVFMKRPFDDPFSAIDAVLRAHPLGGSRMLHLWICIARRRQKRWPWAIGATDVQVWWWGRILMFQRAMRRF